MSYEDPQTYPSAVLGFRVWALPEIPTGASPRLFSIGHAAVAWPLSRGGKRSECIRSREGWRVGSKIHRPHRSPAAFCHCGWNAYCSLDLARLSADRMFGPRGSSVVGAVCGSGLIELHSEGWRSERAQILGLYLTEPLEEEPDQRLWRLWRRQRGAASVYRVPIWSSDQEAQRCISSLPHLAEQPATLWDAATEPSSLPD